MPLLPVVVSPVRAGTPLNAFDDKSGVDPRRYPPDCPVDFQHLRLELSFDDLTSQSFEGVATLTLVPVHDAVTRLELDAVDLDISKVEVDTDIGFRWDYDGRTLNLAFDKALSVDAPTAITVHYRCVEPAEGMIWALPDEAYPNRPLVIHTQGEPEFARYWFPCLDSPVDRCTTEIEVTVPSPYHAVSNGALLDRRDIDGGKRTTFHYRQDQPHTFYLVTLVIGKFNEITDKWRGIDVQYFLPEGSGEVARLTYGKTPEMLEFFSNRFEFPYPYAKYAQINVPLFMFGGMENTSATTMADTAILTPRAAVDQDLEGLIAHELAHQWFGDLITCRSWEHIWLNEGFATFMEGVWKENAKGREEYLYSMWRRFQHVASVDRTDDGPGILHDQYRHPWEVFGFKGSMPYSKGSSVLHVLRHQLGEELFWKGIHEYVTRFAFQQVETNDLRRTLEAVSGRNLEQFFDQWVSRPGVPSLKVTYSWDDVEQQVVVRVEQTQPISRETPAFVLPLDMVFRSGDDVTETTMELSQRVEVYRQKFAEKPTLFCVDPQAGLLARIEEEKPRAMWLDQLRQGPTTITRIVAAKHLVKEGRPEVVEALMAVVYNEQEHWTVRGEAASALGKMNTERGRAAIVALLTDRDGLANHKVRAAVVEAAGSYDDPAVGAALVPYAKSDPSERVEALATKSLGDIRSFGAEAILVANADKDSFGDDIREAAINALARRNDQRAIGVALKYAAYGHHDRIRPVAIRALGRLARENRDRRGEIRSTIARWLSDPQERAVLSSIDALAGIGDAESTAAIRGALEGTMKETHRLAALDALARAKGDTESEDLRSIREELRELREEMSKMRERSRREKPEDGGSSE